MPSSANTTASPSPNTMSRNNSPRPGAAAGGASMRQFAHRHTATPARRANVGSATQTITPPDSSSDRSVSPDPLVLRLRGAHDATASSSSRGHRRRITWAEDVIDNEGLGRKSSKVCCIYHKPREFGESSSEDDSSSSESDSDSGADDGGARMSGNRRGRSYGHGHGHKHSDDCGKGSGKGKRKPSPNAYEKMPKYQGKQPVVKR